MMIGDFRRQLAQSPNGYFWVANAQCMVTSFKKELLNGSHAFGTQAANGVRTVTTKDVFRLALFKVDVSLDATVTAYGTAPASTTNELAGTGGYTQGGVTLSNTVVPATSGTTAYWTPSGNATWSSFTSSGAFDAAVLYNDTSTADLVVAIFTFGSQTITGGTFTLTMPTNDASTGLIRIA